MGFVTWIVAGALLGGAASALAGTGNRSGFTLNVAVGIGGVMFGDVTRLAGDFGAACSSAHRHSSRANSALAASSCHCWELPSCWQPYTNSAALWQARDRRFATGSRPHPRSRRSEVITN